MMSEQLLPVPLRTGGISQALRLFHGATRLWNRFFSAAEFGIGGGFNSAVVGNTFAFVDPTTGYDQFSDGVSAAEAGFNSIASGEAFTLIFDAVVTAAFFSHG